jgi:penicillin-binding protein 1A
MGYNGNGVLTAITVRIIAAFTIIIIIVIGVGLGLSLAMTTNVKNQENFIEFAPALPTKVLDINGTLVTEFAAEEKRELVPLNELPRHLVYAVLSREDPDFYNHRGFSIKAIARAAVGQVIGQNYGGGSTITQQVAGTLYTDRREKTIKRKVKELWWAFQMERRYTKNEILEIYLNYMNMGPGTYGVETTSKHFFNKSAREVTPAEAAILAVLLSNPAGFNPLSRPNEARDRQHFVLDRMIQFGYITAEEAEASFEEYWDNFDWTQPSLSAFYNREDKAPWFSEYVRRELEGLIYGTMDYYRDGYTVYTTLNLAHQEAADKLMAEGLEKANTAYARSSVRSFAQADRTYIPIVEMLTLYFDLTDIRSSASGQNEIRAVSRYTRTINPVVDMAALAFGIPELKDITNRGFEQLKVTTERNLVEGALVSIENETGYITAIVGGSKYDESNQLIRATQANVQPGSSFKPLYYSAAIDTPHFTAASLIYDIPVVFYNEDKTPYIPLNFRGEWKGPVLFYNALAQSMNVPSLKVLDTIGFDAVINRAAALLDITDSAKIRATFPRVYPLGLGIIAVAPLKMARAFSIFGNEGRSVTPIAIRTVEDRNGRVILDPERDLRQAQRRMGSNIQVITPQNAYIMTRILEKTVDEGTLASGAGWGSKFTFRDERGTFKMPMAGKTGTPQNWSDAWAIGYSPYYPTAVWFGFDRPGNSLGVDLTGASLAGPVWGDYMREIHKGLPRRNFVRPSSGIIDVTVCARSGQLRTAACNNGEVTLPFMDGTQPHQYCELHGGKSPLDKPTLAPTVRTTTFDDNDLLNALPPMPTIDLDLFPELQRPQTSTRGNTQTTTSTRNTRTTTTNRNTRTPVAPNNPRLDDGPPPANTPNNQPAIPNEPAVIREDDENLPSWDPLEY